MSDDETNENNKLCKDKSSMTERIIFSFPRKYRIPSDFEVVVPGQHEKMYNPPAGSICVNVESLEAGFRVPICREVADILRALRLNPTQLYPTSYGLLTAWIVLIKSHRYLCGPKIFAYFFNISRSKAGFFYLNPCQERRCLSSAVSFLGRANKWCPKYVYIGSLSPGYDFDLPRKWRRSTFKISKLRAKPAPAFLSEFEGLNKKEWISPYELVVEPILQLAVISSDNRVPLCGVRDIRRCFIINIVFALLVCRILMISSFQQIGGL